MILFNELNTMNHKITEISNVLSILIKDRLICDSETCGNLFQNYIELVNKHIQLVDSSLYVDLLRHSSVEANDTAKNFMSGSQEIKRIMSSYKRKWCSKKHQGISIGRHYDAFLKETSDMFDMVLKRIQDETEHLYPMIRKINEE